jgi:sugar/nucleoside kinase (ribokinase family)
MIRRHELAFVGNYTKDTIVSAAGVRVVDGGAFNYGAHVAAAMGLDTAAITRLAQEDWHVVDRLERLGVRVYAQATSHSTCLRLEYPSANVDERRITVTSTAGAIQPDQVAEIEAPVFVLGASFRGEIGWDVIERLAARGIRLALDVQGFLRINDGGVLVAAPWPGKQQLLAFLNVLKSDAVEAEVLTGCRELRRAARSLASLGPEEVVMTHRDGLLVLAGGQFHEARFHPVELVGRSGRGDTCLAAYVAGRLTGSPAEATMLAAAVTSLKLEAEGPFRRDLDDVQDLIQERYRV